MSIKNSLETLRLSHSLKLVTRIVLIIIVTSISLYFWIVIRSQTALNNLVHYNTPNVAEMFLREIDSQIDRRLSFWKIFTTQSNVQQVLRDSNLKFDQLSNFKEIISQRDLLWVKSQISLNQEAWYQEILNNPPSKRVANLLINDTEPLTASEVFVTNKYGAIVILGSKATDYDQSDEKWWQQAVRDGLSVQNIEYDESSNRLGVSIGIRINDTDGQLMGVLKLVLDQKTINLYLDKIVQERISYASNYTGINGAKLIDSQGDLITSVGGLNYSSDYRNLVMNLIKNNQTFSSYKFSSQTSNTLLSLATSKGYQEYPGVGWNLILENNQFILFKPIQSVIQGLILIIGLCFIFILIVSIRNAYSTSRVISDISQITNDLANGNYNVRTKLKDGDELIELANNFNHLAEKLEGAQKNRNDFISVAIHQLRSPIVATRWTIELIQENETLTDTVKNKLNDVRIVMMQLSNTISDLLRVFKLESIPKSLELSSINLQEVIKKQILEIEPFATKKALNIKVNLPPEPIFINLNAEMFTEIINNLISNAAKYSFQNGLIEITLKIIGDHVQILVSDQGIGIPKSEQKNIYTRFYRAANAQNQKIEGSGLGLYIANENARRLGGNLSFVSQENSGTTFIFTLPLT